MLTESRLRFLGFSLPSNVWRHRYAERFPTDPEMLSLRNWRLFEEENRQCFRQMYQFWAMAEA
jgi:hypothetical protein